MDCELFVVIRKIAGIIIGYGTDELGDISFEDRRNQDPNPIHQQSDSGIFLVFSHNGTPWALTTPWGEWNFAAGITGNSNQWAALEKELVQKFHAILVSGPSGKRVYGLTEFEGQRLQIPMPREKRDFLLDEVAYSQWQAMNNRYEKENS